MADPYDFTKRYNTSLSPEEERSFQRWLLERSKAEGRDLSSDLYDYDWRGFYHNKEYTAADAANGHAPDTYKKPNHPTFSVHSIYNHTPDEVGVPQEGGKWVGNDYIPSAQQVSTPEQQAYLQSYFKAVEPTSKIKIRGR